MDANVADQEVPIGRNGVSIYKCISCPHLAETKEDQWAHARTHIPVDKQLNCNKCNFVTEYGDHLAYHQRNHAALKPFKCKRCIYSCVNKSMLNSHKKTHNNAYPYRCGDCNYATRYCHSIKLHIKRYNHQRETDDDPMDDIFAAGPPIAALSID